MIPLFSGPWSRVTSDSPSPQWSKQHTPSSPSFKVCRSQILSGTCCEQTPSLVCSHQSKWTSRLANFAAILALAHTRKDRAEDGSSHKSATYAALFQAIFSTLLTICLWYELCGSQPGCDTSHRLPQATSCHLRKSSVLLIVCGLRYLWKAYPHGRRRSSGRLGHVHAIPLVICLAHLHATAVVVQAQKTQNRAGAKCTSEASLQSFTHDARPQALFQQGRLGSAPLFDPHRHLFISRTHMSLFHRFQ